MVRTLKENLENNSDHLSRWPKRWRNIFHSFFLRLWCQRWSHLFSSGFASCPRWKNRNKWMQPVKVTHRSRSAFLQEHTWGLALFHQWMQLFRTFKEERTSLFCSCLHFVWSSSEILTVWPFLNICLITSSHDMNYRGRFMVSSQGR